jgi:hypothetical protein
LKPAHEAWRPSSSIVCLVQQFSRIIRNAAWCYKAHAGGSLFPFQHSCSNLDLSHSLSLSRHLHFLLALDLPFHLHPALFLRSQFVSTSGICLLDCDGSQPRSMEQRHGHTRTQDRRAQAGPSEGRHSSVHAVHHHVHGARRALFAVCALVPAIVLVEQQ